VPAGRCAARSPRFGPGPLGVGIVRRDWFEGGVRPLPPRWEGGDVPALSKWGGLGRSAPLVRGGPGNFRPVCGSNRKAWRSPGVGVAKVSWPVPVSRSSLSSEVSGENCLDLFATGVNRVAPVSRLVDVDGPVSLLYRWFVTKKRQEVWRRSTMKYLRKAARSAGFHPKLGSLLRTVCGIFRSSVSLTDSRAGASGLS
jgi:hypothetical protein